MTATTKHRANLTLIEVLIAVVLLGVVGFLLVRGMGIARERVQRRQMVEAMEEYLSPFSRSERRTKAAERIWALVKANPKLHDTKSSDGNTPLYIAAYHGNREIAQWLLDHGANVNAKDKDGWTPLHRAVWWGHKTVVELLLEKGADVNVKTNVTDTPLLLAAHNGHKEVVELLLAKGADINAKGNFDETALGWAKRYHGHLIDLLLKHGAKE